MVDVISASVWYGERKVGTIGQNGQVVAFQYDEEWIHSGFSISPFSLPLEKKLFLGPKDPFRGVSGVFDDLLPDGWGQLLTDRYLKKNGIEPNSVNMVTRLTLLSSDGMGALHFLPEQMQGRKSSDALDFDELKNACDTILHDQECPRLDELYGMAGSSGGARPKAYISLDGESWIVKFPSSSDHDHIGEEEYRYNQCAMHCGLEVAEHRLLPSSSSCGYFATKRFDRNKEKRIHMVSLGGLLEASHRYPTLDYEHLFKVSAILSKEKEERVRVFRHMCFNELAHNWDDHAKNFAFLYEEETGWRLSPAYDLTNSSSFGGEHATMINHKGKGIGREDLFVVGGRFGLGKHEMQVILDQMDTTIKEELKN